MNSTEKTQTEISKAFAKQITAVWDKVGNDPEGRINAVETLADHFASRVVKAIQMGKEAGQKAGQQEAAKARTSFAAHAAPRVLQGNADEIAYDDFMVGFNSDYKRRFDPETGQRYQTVRFVH